jgi:hypothetical protein
MEEREDAEQQPLDESEDEEGGVPRRTREDLAELEATHLRVSQSAFDAAVEEGMERTHVRALLLDPVAARGGGACVELPVDRKERLALVVDGAVEVRRRRQRDDGDGGDDEGEEAPLLEEWVRGRIVLDARAAVSPEALERVAGTQDCAAFRSNWRDRLQPYVMMTVRAGPPGPGLVARSIRFCSPRATPEQARAYLLQAASGASAAPSCLCRLYSNDPRVRFGPVVLFQTLKLLSPRGQTAVLNVDLNRGYIERVLRTLAFDV